MDPYDSMEKQQCSYPWRSMYEGYPPECYVRVPGPNGEPDCGWCAYGGGGCKKRVRK